MEAWKTTLEFYRCDLRESLSFCRVRFALVILNRVIVSLGSKLLLSVKHKAVSQTLHSLSSQASFHGLRTLRALSKTPTIKGFVIHVTLTSPGRVTLKTSLYFFSFIKFCIFFYPVPVNPHSPSHGLKNHNAVLDAAGPSHVAISAISANMDSFARGRTAILKKQPSHMEAAHFGDLGTQQVFLCFRYA